MFYSSKIEAKNWLLSTSNIPSVKTDFKAFNDNSLPLAQDI